MLVRSRRILAWMTAVVGLVSTFVMAAPDEVKTAGMLPNLVLIFADDLGYGDLSCFGNTSYKTPELDRMAAEGVRLTSFYVTCGACSPSRASILTGRYPTSAGVPVVLGPRDNYGLRRDTPTIAEVLKQKGYTTGIVGKWHLGHLPELLPTRRGFDSYFGIPYSNDMKPTPLMRNEKIVEQQIDQTQLTRRYTEEATRFVKASAESGNPFFLYFAHSFPHVPLHVSERFKGKSGAGLYGDVVTELDWSVGEILRVLKETGGSTNTLVLFTSDNGPWLIMKEHGGSAGQLRNGKGSAYEGGVREPFIAWWPGRLKAGGVIDTPAISLDILPTFCELAGATPPAVRDGQSIWPLLAGTAAAGKRTFFFPDYYAHNHAGAVRDGDWKLVVGRKTVSDIRPTTAPSAPDQSELFFLPDDPGEKRDLAAEKPEIVEKLTALANAKREQFNRDEAPREKPGKKSTAALRFLTPGTPEYMGQEAATTGTK